MANIVLTRQQVREIDRRASADLGISTEILMENAGRGAADVLESLGISADVVICAGTGNNGGDAFVMARHLDARGYNTRIVVFGSKQKLTKDAACNLGILEKMGAAITVLPDEVNRSQCEQALANCQWIVDGLLGIGSRGAPRPPLDLVIREISRANASRFAIDIPSGLDCDTGDAPGEVIQADHTCTFVAPKPALLMPHCQSCTGQLHVVNLGIPRQLISAVIKLA